MADRQNLVHNAAPIAGVDLEAGGQMNTGQQQQQPESQNIFKQSSHPVALMFHLAFRVGAIVTYLLCSSIVSSDVLCIVLIVLLLAFDFWTVKNVTGRLLVGLRWWNEVREDGTSEWVFESRENRLVNAVDSRVFWFTLYITPVIWILFALLCLIYLKLLWLVVTIVAVTMNSANLFGYTKCEKNAKAKVASYLAGHSGVQNIVGNIIANRIGGFIWGGTPAAAT